MPCAVRGNYGVGFWKETRKAWEIVLSHAVFSTGDGRRVSFWKYRWCGEMALCTSFPSLVALAADKEAETTVVNVWEVFL